MNVPSPEPPRRRSGGAAPQRPAAGEPPADMAAWRVPGPVDAALRELAGRHEDALVLAQPDLTLGYANEAMARLAGRPVAELLGRHLGAVLAAADPPLDGPAVRQTLADGGPRFVRLVVGPAEERRVLEVHASRTEQGLLALRLRDTTATVALEQALARAVAESEAAFAENALHRDLAGCVARATDDSALRALCLVARRVCDAERAVVFESRDAELRPVTDTGDGGDAPDAELAARAAGDERLRRASTSADGGAAIAAPLVAHGRVLGVLLLARAPGAAPFTAADERHLRLVAEHAALALWKVRLLEQTEAASEAKSSFLATMSHELRTPLTALTGYGELLDDEILGPLSGPQHEMVSRMCGVIQGLSGMIDEMLMFSTLEAGREVVRLARVGSGELLQATAAVVEPAARQRGLALRVVVPDGAPRLETDPDKARKILGHLAGNAVKFTERGHVTLSVEQRDGEVRFAVADTGLGLPPGVETTIFEPFVQLDSGLTRRYGGTGLGLYIASRLARLLGGRIEVCSELGAGSVFELVLPAGR